MAEDRQTGIRGRRSAFSTPAVAPALTTPEVAWQVIIGSGSRGALEKVPADRWDTVRALYLTSLRDAGVTGLDAATLIGSGRRAT
ncbi:hypothetical protein [Lentzea sp. NEAU-D7]|uniref:hypothetical protein n=1 Tax=Lentzea sp. NEAU-D7 TaxID=2994667 RepID=UPI00224B1D42|nr:hypothetical protein [Lentzea sp. NEAU-D7]MCX2946730.1 hypothetical protein [Lentzea sp. NEAU-D7]